MTLNRTTYLALWWDVEFARITSLMVSIPSLDDGIGDNCLCIQWGSSL